MRNGHAVAVAVFAALISGALVANQLAAAAARGDGSVPGAALLAALVLLGHAALVVGPGRTSAHFHHWYSGFLGSCFCVFEGKVSLVAHAMLLGIFLHGAAYFGVERIFYADETENSKPAAPRSLDLV